MASKHKNMHHGNMPGKTRPQCMLCGITTHIPPDFYLIQTGTGSIAAVLCRACSNPLASYSVVDRKQFEIRLYRRIVEIMLCEIQETKNYLLEVGLPDEEPEGEKG